MDTLKIGDKIKFCNERCRYTIQAFDERFIIATRPHFNTYMYTIIDRKERVRGAINTIFGLPCDVDTPDGAGELLQQMRYEHWHVSRRNRLPLTKAEIMQIKGGE